MSARVGRLLEQKCRQSNVVARYGGDEFIILMPETGVEQAQTLAERLRLWISQDPTLSEHHITGSFGVGSFPCTVSPWKTLFASPMRVCISPAAATVYPPPKISRKEKPRRCDGS